MANVDHRALPMADIHIPYAFSYADATARAAATGFVSADVGKLALQRSDNTLWLLTATTPTWVAVGGSGGSMTDPETTAGDMIYRDGSNVTSRLPVGTNGQVLTVVSGVPAWAAAGGGSGSLTVISDQTLGAAAATIDFSSIAGTYKHVHMTVMGRSDTAANNTFCYVQVNGDSTASYTRAQINSVNNSLTGQELTNDTAMFLMSVPGATPAAGLVCSAQATWLYYAGTTFHKQMIAQTMETESASDVTLISQRMIGSSWRSTAAITRLTLTLGAGNWIAGSRATLYGIS